jgi:ribulose-phosphate 3-epimerase
LNVRVAPSILAADFARLGEEIAAVERAGADLIHIDVMDGHFVPNLSMGPAVVEAVSRVTRLPRDVHLMILEPERYVEAFASAGASMISVHVEVVGELPRALAAIRAAGCRAGVAISPPTPVQALGAVAGDVDHVLVMSVNPGFGGQAFLAESESKVTAIRSLLDQAGNAAPIEIDGGIDAGNAERVVRAGAEILIAGASIFKGGDPGGAVRRLRAAALAGVTA